MTPILVLGSIAGISCALLGATVAALHVLSVVRRLIDADERAVRAESEARSAEKRILVAEELRRLAEDEVGRLREKSQALSLAAEEAEQHATLAQEALDLLKKDRDRIECDSCRTLLAEHVAATDEGKKMRAFCSSYECLQRAQRRVKITPEKVKKLVDPDLPIQGIGHLLAGVSSASASGIWAAPMSTTSAVPSHSHLLNRWACPNCGSANVGGAYCEGCGRSRF